MTTFAYHTPDSLEEALALLGEHGDDAHILAGGTSFMLLWKQGLIQPGHVVSLGGVKELRGISARADGGLEIRAFETHRSAEVSSAVAAYCPALTETFSHVATIRIRNQATIGGNLVHADPAQDPPPMLLALGAEATLAGPKGTRTVPLDGFFKDIFETAIQEGEILTSVQLPPLAKGTRAAYTKFLPRTADDYATVAVAAALTLDDANVCTSLRIGLGALGVTPLRARAVEKALIGQTLTPSVLADASVLVMAEVDPLDDLRGSAGYKREMARVWVRRTLEKLVTGSATIGAGHATATV